MHLWNPTRVLADTASRPLGTAYFIYIEACPSPIVQEATWIEWHAVIYPWFMHNVFGPESQGAKATLCSVGSTRFREDRPSHLLGKGLSLYIHSFLWIEPVMHWDGLCTQSSGTILPRMLDAIPRLRSPSSQSPFAPKYIHTFVLA